MNRKQLDIVCFHEAGHAVMAFLCGAMVESVTVSPEPFVQYRYSSKFPPQIRALISLAGMAADYIHWQNDTEKQSDENITGDKSDQRRALDTLQEINHSEYIGQYIAFSSRILNSFPYIGYLKEIAQLLILKSELSSEEIVHYFNNIPKYDHSELVESIERIILMEKKFGHLLPSN